MKQYWQRLVLKIDALSLRERAIIFAMAALILVVLVNNAVLDPQYARQKQLSQRIKQDQSVIAAIQAEIRQKALSQQTDPDQANKVRLQQLRQQFTQMQVALQDMQKGLVSPDKMSELLEDILTRHGGLRLVSLKTLPASSLTEPALPQKTAAGENAAQAAAASAVSKGTIYRHGVEIVVRGEYLEIMNYLAQLEAMPWQLFWGKARLNVDEHPTSTLTLTLFTLSLDGEWLNL